MKKYISIALSILMVVSMLTLLSGCGDKGSKGLEFKSNGDGTCAVIGIGSCEDEELVIPKKSPDGDKVTSIGDKAFYNSKVRSVSMPNTITQIGVEAFFACNRLEDITFSSTLKKIESNAFWACDSITEIVLPDSLEEFGKNIGSDGKEYEGSGVFNGCEKLAKINIPKNLKAIYENTFKGTALTEIEIDADFKYGRFDIMFYNDKEEPVYYYLPALYLSNPELDDKDILELTDEMKTILYSAVFHSNDLKINSKENVMPTAQATPGFYGAEDDRTAYKITEDGKIEEYYYDTTYGKYEIDTTYPENEEKVYDFEYNKISKAYEFKNEDGDIQKFVVYGKYFFTINGRVYQLDTECKD